MVPARGRQPRSGAFVALLVALLAGGLVGLLVLNTAMQRSAFQLEDMRDRSESLSVRRQVLDMRVDRLRSPERLAREATDLGMVAMTSPAFLHLEDGRVLGDPVPAVAGSGPELVPETPVRTRPETPVRTVPEPVRTPTTVGRGPGVSGQEQERPGERRPQQPDRDGAGGGDRR